PPTPGSNPSAGSCPIAVSCATACPYPVGLPGYLVCIRSGRARPPCRGRWPSARCAPTTAAGVAPTTAQTAGATAQTAAAAARRYPREPTDPPPRSGRGLCSSSSSLVPGSSLVQGARSRDPAPFWDETPPPFWDDRTVQVVFSFAL